MTTNGNGNGYSPLMNKFVNGMIVLAVLMLFFSFIWGVQNAAGIVELKGTVQQLSDRIESDRRINKMLPHGE